MNKPIDQEREAFEANLLSEIPHARLHRRDALPKDDPMYGWYVDEHVSAMWQGWQARAAVQPAGGAVPDCGFAAGVKAASDHVKTLVSEYDERHGSTDPDTGTREYPGNGEEWVGQMLELIEDFTGIVAPAAPHPVSGGQKPEPRPSWLDGGAEAVAMAEEDELNAVAGLVAALEHIEDIELASAGSVSEWYESRARIREVVGRALAAHRAQQGGQ